MAALRNQSGSFCAFAERAMVASAVMEMILVVMLFMLLQNYPSHAEAHPVMNG